MLGSDFQPILGTHQPVNPCEAAEVVPCCVFPRLFHQRRLWNGGGVTGAGPRASDMHLHTRVCVRAWMGECVCVCVCSLSRVAGKGEAKRKPRVLGGPVLTDPCTEPWWTLERASSDPTVGYTGLLRFLREKDWRCLSGIGLKVGAPVCIRGTYTSGARWSSAQTDTGCHVLQNAK